MDSQLRDVLDADAPAGCEQRSAGHTVRTRVTRPRARFAPGETSPRAPGIPVGVERERLREVLGAELRAARRQAGMSQWTLARRAGFARSTAERLEAGLLRPTRSLLATIAVGLQRTLPPRTYDPEAARAVFHRLLAAAGASAVSDTPAGVDRRERRLRAAGRLWARHARQIVDADRARRRARDVEFRACLRLLRRANAMETPRILDRMGAL